MDSCWYLIDYLSENSQILFLLIILTRNELIEITRGVRFSLVISLMYSFILFRYAFILIYCFSIYVSTVEFLLKQCKVIYHIKILITIINAWMLVIVSLNFVCCFLFVCLLEILVNKKLVFLLMNSGHPSSKNKIKIYLTK